MIFGVVVDVTILFFSRRKAEALPIAIEEKRNT